MRKGFLLSITGLLACPFIFAGNFNESIVYTTYYNHTFGFYMAVVAILTFVFIMFERIWEKK